MAVCHPRRRRDGSYRCSCSSSHLLARSSRPQQQPLSRTSTQYVHVYVRSIGTYRGSHRGHHYCASQHHSSSSSSSIMAAASRPRFRSSESSLSSSGCAARRARWIEDPARPLPPRPSLLLPLLSDFLPVCSPRFCPHTNQSTNQPTTRPGDGRSEASPGLRGGEARSRTSASPAERRQ
jgi:hypothetical protein